MFKVPTKYQYFYSDHYQILKMSIFYNIFGIHIDYNVFKVQYNIKNMRG